MTSSARPRALEWALCIFTLAGCSAVGPTYRPPEPIAVPAQYLEPAGNANLLSTWQALLRDPVLQQLQTRALADSPDLALALARLGQARAVQAVQEGSTGPTLNASAQASSDMLSKNGEMFANVPPVQNLKSQFINTQAGFDASWEIDLFGYQRRLSEAANARTEAVAVRAQDARVTLTAEVARNYMELRLWQQRLQLALVQLKAMDDQLAITRVAVEHGETAKMDGLRLQNQRDNFAATLPALAFSERQNLAALSPLTGMPMAELQSLLQPTDSLPAMPEAPAAGLPAELLKHRPDVRAAERDWAAASADVGVATAAQYPRISLVGSAGWQSVHDNDLFTAASEFWSVGPRVSLPLFNSGRLANQVVANEAALDAARVSYRKTLLSAVADVDASLSRLSRYELRRTQLVQAEAQQQEILRLTQAQFNAGAVAQFEVIAAQRNLNTQQDQLAQAQGQSLTALVALYKALGGGWADTQ
jgi:NodT family efflux transporter outer membrane factor (OMF) lipoprotein